MAEPRTLMIGIAFGESPRWHEDRLWFADWGAKEIIAVNLVGKSEVMVRVGFPSFPMCMDWMPDGRLLIVSARDGLLLRGEPDGSLVTHADLSGLAQKGHPLERDSRGRPGERLHQQPRLRLSRRQVRPWHHRLAHA